MGTLQGQLMITAVDDRFSAGVGRIILECNSLNRALEEFVVKAAGCAGHALPEKWPKVKISDSYKILKSSFDSMFHSFPRILREIDYIQSNHKQINLKRNDIAHSMFAHSFPKDPSKPIHFTVFHKSAFDKEVHYSVRDLLEFASEICQLHGRIHSIQASDLTVDQIPGWTQAELNALERLQR